MYAVDLDAKRSRVVSGTDANRLGKRAPIAHSEFFDSAQCSASGASDIVGPTLETVEFFDDGEWNHNIDVAEAADAARVGDEHRRVEDKPGSLSGSRRAGLSARNKLLGRSPQEIGHGHPFKHHEAINVGCACWRSLSVSPCSQI